MRAIALAVAAFAMTLGDVSVAPLAHADGIEPPRRERPVPRLRVRPAPPVEAPAPIYRESPPTPLFVPAPPSNEIHLSDGFFNSPLAGGVGYGLNSNAVGGGGGRAYAVASSRTVVSVTSTSFGGGGSCRRC
ncbi:MAG: hypothetical protein ACOYKM_12710 [Caulobacterales bacterium]